MDKRHSHAARGSHVSRRVARMARLSAVASTHLAFARDRLARVPSPSILVALSGKDSLTVLDLCCQRFRVEAFHMYIVPGLETFEAPLHQAARRHGIPLHLIPHWDLARLVKHAVLRPHVLHASSIRERKLCDAEALIRAQTGIEWIASGERASDSFNRRFYTHQNDGIAPKTRRVYPIYDWRDAEVYGYLRARKIPAPDNAAFVHGRGVSGFALNAQCLTHLQQHHPADYQRVLAVFPYAEIEIIRAAGNPSGPKTAPRPAQAPNPPGIEVSELPSPSHPPP